MPSVPCRRYLDQAATSWPKPEPVLAAWNRAAREVGAVAGRAAYRSAAAAGALRDQARAAAARLLGAADPARVALPGGCTLALNLAIHGLVRPGDHVIATAADHNAVLRPLHALARRGVVTLSIVPCDGTGFVDIDAVAAAWSPATRLVACTHASNVTGRLQDVAGMAAVAHARGGILLVDAAQTLGTIPCDAIAAGADVVAAPAHKWVQGTAGVGVLWARPGIDPEAIVQGGTGAASESLDMPDAFPDRLEPGTPDVPALAALAAAGAWHEGQAAGTVGRDLARQCAARLGGVPGVRVLVAEGAPIVSFTVDGYDPAHVAVILEQAAGIEVRSGLHCAARVHEYLGTAAGGTVRASFGPFNGPADVEALVRVVETIRG